MNSSAGGPLHEISVNRIKDQKKDVRLGRKVAPRTSVSSVVTHKKVVDGLIDDNKENINKENNSPCRNVKQRANDLTCVIKVTSLKQSKSLSPNLCANNSIQKTVKCENDNSTNESETATDATTPSKKIPLSLPNNSAATSTEARFLIENADPNKCVVADGCVIQNSVTSPSVVIQENSTSKENNIVTSNVDSDNDRREVLIPPNDRDVSSYGDASLIQAQLSNLSDNKTAAIAVDVETSSHPITDSITEQKCLVISPEVTVACSATLNVSPSLQDDNLSPINNSSLNVSQNAIKSSPVSSEAQKLEVINAGGDFLQSSIAAGSTNGEAIDELRLPQNGSVSCNISVTSPVFQATNCPSSVYCNTTPKVPLSRRNARERNRVRLVSQGFAILRQHVPQAARRKKLSKVETLRCAVDYIKAMSRMIEENNAKQQQNSMPMSSASFNGQQVSSSSANQMDVKSERDETRVPLPQELPRQHLQTMLPMDSRSFLNASMLSKQSEQCPQITPNKYTHDGTKLLSTAALSSGNAMLNSALFGVAPLNDSNVTPVDCLGSHFDQYQGQHESQMLTPTYGKSVNTSLESSPVFTSTPSSSSSSLSFAGSSSVSDVSNIIDEQKDLFDSNETDDSELMDCLSWWQEMP